ncbi:epididymal-specific lipocalin-12 isoform X1 [Papio anubis]|uniref:epididymal-specific lipocalin-12 isoform X1 n=1 Tax=Papio anubis TaxID=9555 RepID=UPI0004F1EBD1|nr:epididymal-specific lipocalin-12 isoform X1 [Papio anubis]
MRLPCGLWLWLSLLKVLQGQTPRPPTLPPPMQSFQGNQFQGEWFVLGLAGNSFRPEHRALLNPFTATFELSDDGRFEVWNAMTRGQHCDTWSYVLIPAAQPGQFTVDHGVGPGADREETRVVNSDYTQFALMLSRRHTSKLAILRISLLSRNWLLPPGTLDQFFCLSRAQGLSDDNIVFPDVTGGALDLSSLPWVAAPAWPLREPQPSRPDSSCGRARLVTPCQRLLKDEVASAQPGPASQLRELCPPPLSDLNKCTMPRVPECDHCDLGVGKETEARRQLTL